VNNSIRIALALALCVVAGVSQVVLAANPSKDDVTVLAWGGAPACTLDEAHIYMGNASDDYYYKVRLDATAENNSPGEERCGSDPPGCNYERCECDLKGTYVVDPSQTIDLNSTPRTGKETDCMLPSCGPCGGQNCENASCGPPADHCICIFGTYKVEQYSSNGLQWFDMPPSFPTAITVTDRSGVSCPTPECDYD